MFRLSIRNAHTVSEYLFMILHNIFDTIDYIQNSQFEIFALILIK